MYGAFYGLELGSAKEAEYVKLINDAIEKEKDPVRVQKVLARKLFDGNTIRAQVAYDYLLDEFLMETEKPPDSFKKSMDEI